MKMFAAQPLRYDKNRIFTRLKITPDRQSASVLQTEALFVILLKNHVGRNAMTLQEFFAENPSVAVALSGGVDSAYLLYAASRLAQHVKAYCVASPFQPQFELDTARALAERCGVPLEFILLDILAVPEAAANGADRCYHCKKALFTALCAKARQDGFSLIADGTNASDAEDDRPGMRALRELGVRSPLRECGLTKARIRTLAREAGIEVWNRPAYACLATRVATGETITQELLEHIEQAENALFAMGYSDFRVRVRHGEALLQLPAEQLESAQNQWITIRQMLETHFTQATLDPKPRRST
jgi:uncharacterized protein